MGQKSKGDKLIRLKESIGRYGELADFMRDYFGLSYDEFECICFKLKDATETTRLDSTPEHILNVFESLKPFGVTKRDFAEIFKYGLSKIKSKLELFSCFGISMEDLRKTYYYSMRLFDTPISTLESKLMTAVLGGVKLPEELETFTSNYKGVNIFARLLKYEMSKDKPKNLFEISITKQEADSLFKVYQERNPNWRTILFDRFKKSFPETASLLEVYNERYLPHNRISYLLSDGYGISYKRAVEITANNPMLSKMPTKAINARLKNLINLGYTPEEIVSNPLILALPKKKVLLRYTLSQYTGISREFFLNQGFKSNERVIYARFAGTDELKCVPEKYYASDLEFTLITGLYTKDLLDEFPLDSEVEYYLTTPIEKIKEDNENLSNITKHQFGDE